MSQGIGQHELQEKTQKLLQGPLKHVRAAALAAALLPLASVAAAPAAAQDCPQSSAGTVCGFVWNDTDGDGLKDADESGIANSTVTLGSGSIPTTTDSDGFYYFTEVPDGTYEVTVDNNQDGTTDSVASVAVTSGGIFHLDFGFTPSDGSSDGVVSGVVWNDTDRDGVQDAGEPRIEGAKVYVCQLCDGTDTVEHETNTDGSYSFIVPNGTYTIGVLWPSGMQPSPTDSNFTNDTLDSDGVPVGAHSVASATLANGTVATDFGFYKPAVQGPGTGTPGYWKNHPNAWPAEGLWVGGVYYPKLDAITWLGRVGKDKTTTMFSSLVSAMLNVKIGNLSGCVDDTIVLANTWMAAHPVGSGVAGSSAAWAQGEPLHMLMDAYNNGLLCAKHRN